jgi:hypothetical protein
VSAWGVAFGVAWGAAWGSTAVASTTAGRQGGGPGMTIHTKRPSHRSFPQPGVAEGGPRENDEALLIHLIG